jgi:hypothetical protein
MKKILKKPQSDRTEPVYFFISLIWLEYHEKILQKSNQTTNQHIFL